MDEVCMEVYGGCMEGMAESSRGQNRCSSLRKRETMRSLGTGMDLVFLFLEKGLKRESTL